MATTLAEFLNRYPWGPEWSGKGKPLDFLWSWDFPVEPAKLWPHLIDTSKFNKRLGLPEMKYSEKDGRLHGTSVNSGMELEWEEIPWEWEYGRGLNTTRLYSKGFAQCVRARYILEEPTPGKTRLYAYFGWIPRGLKGRLLIPVSMAWLHKNYTRVLREIEATVREGLPLSPGGDAPKLPDESLGRLQAVHRDLAKAGCDIGVAQKLISLALSAPDEELLRIRVKPLAHAWGVPERTLLSVVLHATRQGAFVLSWDVLCPHCRGTRLEVQTLGDIPSRAGCEACGIDFAATGLNAIEATFRVHPSIRKIVPKRYCAAEPATKPHILLQRALPAGKTEAVETILPPGRYRMRIQSVKDYALLDVDRDREPGRFEWEGGARLPNLASGPHPALLLKNPSDKERTFIVEELKIDQDALRPGDLFAFQEFRDLFPDQSVGYDIQLEIGVQTVLFTDLVGSTRFYETAGDSAAFAQVRQHFVKVFEAVRNNSGAVVKTIGDAAMGAFEHPRDALRAAVALQEWFNKKNPATALRIRISLHLGPCLAVNLNSGIDYFGSTVNLASKLQAMAESQQIVFTEAVKNDPAAAQYLSELPYRPEALDFPLKWSGGKIRVHRFEVA